MVLKAEKEAPMVTLMAHAHAGAAGLLLVGVILLVAALLGSVARES